MHRRRSPVRPEPARRRGAADPHHGPRRPHHAAQARRARPLHHPARRREPHPLCRGEHHDSRHQAFQGRLLRLRRPGRRPGDGREDRRQRQGQRPGVCNAAEQLLVHATPPRRSCRAWPGRLLAKDVQLRCDAASAASSTRTASPPRRRTGRLHRRFLDLIIAVRVVAVARDAIATINRDGSAHSDAIVTRDPPRRSVSSPAWTAPRVLEREHALQRRLRVRLRRRDRHQHRPAARPRPDGPARALLLQSSSPAPARCGRNGFGFHVAKRWRSSASSPPVCFVESGTTRPLPLRSKHLP